MERTGKTCDKGELSGGERKTSHISNPSIPDPTKHGWKFTDGLLQPHLFDGSELPDQLVEIAATDVKDSGDDSKTESDAELDYQLDVAKIFMDSDDDEI